MQNNSFLSEQAFFCVNKFLAAEALLLAFSDDEERKLQKAMRTDEAGVQAGVGLSHFEMHTLSSWIFGLSLIWKRSVPPPIPAILQACTHVLHPGKCWRVLQHSPGGFLGKEGDGKLLGNFICPGHFFLVFFEMVGASMNSRKKLFGCNTKITVCVWSNGLVATVCVPQRC